MASIQEPKFPLRLLVDKEKNRVVVAESKSDLVDILFSFLTLPLGTIIRLVSNNQHDHIHEINDQPQDTFGCIHNLYKSVENFSDGVFWNNICKTMLLRPRNPCEALCKKLKLNLDDSESTKYFMCGRCNRGSDWFLSTFVGASCCYCGKLMDKEMKLHGDFGEVGLGDGVFVKKGSLYLIFDDLKVLQNSPGNSVQQLLQLGYKNLNKFKQISLNVGLKEILDLLKQSLISNSPLTDIFLANKECKKMHRFSPKQGPKVEKWTNIKLKLMVRKSKKKILYAEAEGDFVDFLLSFLTTPIGSILEQLDGNFSLGSMENLHKSVKEFNPSWLIKPLGNPLPNPKVASQFGCKKQPLINIYEEKTPSYWYGKGVVKNHICYSNVNGVISKKKSGVKNPEAMKLFDPRSAYGRTESALGFVKRPSLFVVWDDLQVTPLANSSSISFLHKMNVSLDDLEEHVVSIGETEALNLLGASLASSKEALTEGLFHLLMRPKEEDSD
ncbi:unnamed protein product [Lathyrus oleraceus]